MSRKKNYISTKGLSREEWLAHRKRLGIGGSEVGAILGYSKYRTAVDVWLDKTSIELNVMPDDEAMWIGNEIEPMLRKRFTIETGLKVVEDHKIRLHPTIEGLYCNLDGVIRDPDRGPGVFEAKSFLNSSVSNYDNGIPPYVYLQIQHNLSITGYSYAYGFFWIKDRNEFVIHQILPNKDVIEAINKACKEFWDVNVKEYVAPEPRNSEDVAAIHHSAEEGKKVVANERIQSIYEKLVQVKDEIKEKQSLQKILEFGIKSYMKDAQTIVNDENKPLVTWKNANSFDEEALKNAHPDLYEKYSVAFDRKEFAKSHKAIEQKFVTQSTTRKFLVK